MTVLLVDDHPVVIEGLRAVLDQEPDMEVVGEAHNGSEAIARIRTLHPDVVLLDMRIAPPAGAELIRSIREISPATSVAVVTSVPDDDDLVECVAAGAKGYLLKGASVRDFADAIRRVDSGESVIEPSMVGRLIDALVGVPVAATPVESGPLLTEREREVLALVVNGATNREISTELFVSLSTVKAHLGTLYQKLGVHDRTSAAIEALKSGIVDLPVVEELDS